MEINFFSGANLSFSLILSPTLFSSLLLSCFCSLSILLSHTHTHFFRLPLYPSVTHTRNHLHGHTLTHMCTHSLSLTHSFFCLGNKFNSSFSSPWRQKGGKLKGARCVNKLMQLPCTGVGFGFGAVPFDQTTLPLPPEANFLKIKFWNRKDRP